MSRRFSQQSCFVGLGLVLIATLPLLSHGDEASADRPSKEIKNSLDMKLVLIPSGIFTMGAPKDEDGSFNNEYPQHEVEISKAFYMAACPVTRGQFTAFTEAAHYKTEAEKGSRGGYGFNVAESRWEEKPKYSWRNPGFEQADDHPVVEVSCKDAKAFCAWLSKKEGKTYELPTEAEWEYACRAGTKTRYWWGEAVGGLKECANLADASLKEKMNAKAAKGWIFVPWDDGYAFTSPVGSFKANPWGLYDMGGNVWQWCGDEDAPYREGTVKDPRGKDGGNTNLVRGGSWNDEPRFCRSAFRIVWGPMLRGGAVGFRVVMRLPAEIP